MTTSGTMAEVRIIEKCILLLHRRHPALASKVNSNVNLLSVTDDVVFMWRLGSSNDADL